MSKAQAFSLLMAFLAGWILSGGLRKSVDHTGVPTGNKEQSSRHHSHDSQDHPSPLISVRQACSTGERATCAGFMFTEMCAHHGANGVIDAAADTMCAAAKCTIKDDAALCCRPAGTGETKAKVSTSTSTTKPAGAGRPTITGPTYDTRQTADPSWQALGRVSSSSHSCFGRDFVEESWKRNTCMYNNVCYFPEWHKEKSPGSKYWGDGRGEIVYIVDSDAERTHLKETRDLEVELLPLNAIHTKPYHEAGHLTPVMITRPEFESRVRQLQEDSSGDVEDASSEAVRYVSNLHILYTSFNAENFGHFLTDELLPAYSMMESFDDVTYDVQLMRAETHPRNVFSCDWQRETWGEVQWGKCQKRYKELTYLLSNNPVKRVQDYAASILKTADSSTTASKTPLCFRRLMAGTGMLADHCEDQSVHGRNASTRHECNRGRQGTLYNFRAHTMRILGLEPSIDAARRSERDPVRRVLIWDRPKADQDKRKATRKIYGFPELCKAIKTKFHVECEIFEEWERKPIKEQISKMASSEIFITGPGSGSHIGWYLPRGATMIRIYPELATHMMEWHLFQHLSHIEVEYIKALGGVFEQEHLLMLVNAALKRFDGIHSYNKQNPIEHTS